MIDIAERMAAQTQLIARQRKMVANDAAERPETTTALAIGDAVEPLVRAAEMLTSMGLHRKAVEVRAIAQRLHGGHAGTCPNVFRREGEYRLVIYGSDVFRLRETLGLAYLAKLLSSPGARGPRARARGQRPTPRVGCAPVDWWTDENELHHKNFLGGPSPTELRPAGPEDSKRASGTSPCSTSSGGDRTQGGNDA